MLAKCWPNTGVDDVHTGVNIGRRRELFCLWPCLSTHNAQIDCTESLPTQSTLTCSLMSSGVPLSKRPGATPSRGRGPAASGEAGVAVKRGETESQATVPVGNFQTVLCDVAFGWHGGTH